MIRTTTEYLNQTTVSIKDLCAALCVKTYFSTWFKTRIRQRNLVQGIDYEKEQTRGAYGIDYFVTINTALDLAKGNKQVVEELDNLLVGVAVKFGLVEVSKPVGNTMSSTELAEMTGKQKTNIHRDIKVQLLIGLYGLEDDSKLNDVKIQGLTVVLDNRGYWQEVYLDREHTLTLITGYDVKARHAINKRWMELEGQTTQPTTKSPTELSRLEILQLALESEKALQEANTVIAEMQPKVDIYERFVEIPAESISLRKASQLLGMKEQDFIAELVNLRWIFKEKGEHFEWDDKTNRNLRFTSYAAYSTIRQKGWMEHKPVERNTQYGVKVFGQVLVTGEGMRVLRECGKFERKWG